MTITDKAVESIKASNKIIGRLMIAFNRGQNTIENWMASKDVRLTTPDATKIITEETGLSYEEILEEDTVKEQVSESKV